HEVRCVADPACRAGGRYHFLRYRRHVHPGGKREIAWGSLSWEEAPGSHRQQGRILPAGAEEGPGKDQATDTAAHQACRHQTRGYPGRPQGHHYPGLLTTVSDGSSRGELEKAPD